MKELMANSTPLPEGTVILAEHQTAGKGQRQNGWHSQNGKNLTFSLLLYPNFIISENFFDLIITISLGVIKPLQDILGNKVNIKWPNDIYYGQKKLGGILIENILAGKSIKYAVVGIGLNVNQEDFPEDLPNPTSIKKILQKENDLKEVLSQICAGIEYYYLKLKSGSFTEIKQAYLNNLLGFGREMHFKSGEETFKGEICTVNQLGLLGVRIENETKFFDLKEIKFIFNQP